MGYIDAQPLRHQYSCAAEIIGLGPSGSTDERIGLVAALHSSIIRGPVPYGLTESKQLHPISLALTITMAPNNSKWWQAPDEADLDYGFDSDDLDARFTGPGRDPRLRGTNEDRYRDQAQTNELQKPRDQEGDKGVIGNMSDWFSRQVGSHNSQLAATAVFSAVTVAGGILGYQAHQRKGAVRDLKASIPVADEQHPSDKVSFWGREKYIPKELF